MSGYSMFTHEEALEFLTNQLGVADAQDRLSWDRRTLLDEITTNLQIRLPFTNLGLMSIERDERRRPNLGEIKRDVLSGKGGLCYHLNVANFYILKALGFNVVLASAAIPVWKTHIIVYVHNVEKTGDTFLAEAGVGYPTFRAICLDHDETPTFRDSFLEYKYIKRDGKLLRLHRQGDLGGGRSLKPVCIDGWRVVYTADLKGTSNIEEFYPKFDQMYIYHLQAQDPLITQFHAVFRLVQFPEKRAVIISNQKLILEKDNGLLETEVLEDGDDAILRAVRRYFPAIPEDMATRALANWRRTLQA
ncbi:hypothetical protein RRG08_031544 [Elysia crispata]|uniref:arylamine N-acetyltransferase n=1 Tax=Elysia crispata TaxID=231223 RepID=A0AAE0YV89_9GAST|nr:hypothetical protein RRG08_031544 [Elysia crispata]